MDANKCTFKQGSRANDTSWSNHLPVEGNILTRSSSISNIDMISCSLSSSTTLLSTPSALRSMKSRMRASQAL